MADYRVKDLYLAAFLYSQKCQITSVEREGSVCWFVFDDTSGLRALANNYLIGNAEGNVNSFVDSIRRLKDLIFGQR